MLFQLHRPLPLFWQFSLIVFLWLGLEPGFAEESPDVRKYQIKASFLVNLSRYITYPKEVFSNSGSAFNICIFGEDPIQGFLDALVKGKKIRGRLIKLSYLEEIEKVGKCQVLFISSSKQQQLPQILAYVKSRPILTVSDIDDFIDHGGMFQFYTLGDNKGVRFMIDYVTTKEAKLEMDAPLLQLAKIVRKERPSTPGKWGMIILRLKAYLWRIVRLEVI